MTIFDDKMAIKKPYGRIKTSPDGWLDGEVVTPQGIVTVYAQGDEVADHYTRLDFVFDQTHYMRTFDKRYTSRGIITKATQFVNEILTGGVK